MLDGKTLGRRLKPWSFFLVLLGLVLSAADGVPVSANPNVVLMMCDDLGWGDVGFNGGTSIQTPNLDRLAKDSLVLRRFYAASPVCSPTRGSCLTGRHPFRFGVYFANVGHLKPDEITLAEMLRRCGYTTGHFGKWHLGTLTKNVKDANRGGRPDQVQNYAPPQANGFDVCFSTESKVPTYDPMLRPAVDAGNAWDAIEDTSKALPYGTRYWNEQGEIVTENLDGDDARVIMDRAIPFVEKAVAKGCPFLAVIWFHSPHLPVVAGPEHQKDYRHVRQTLHRNYYACVTAMDEQVGRLQQTLARLRVEDDTLLCFCSDNGPEGNRGSPGSAGPFRGRKRSLYEGGIRVPSLIHWPSQIPVGRTTNFAAVTSDYLPTVLDVVGLPLPDDRPLDGISLLPLIQNRIADRPDPIPFQSRKRTALSGRRFKLIGNVDEDEWELYDLMSDPSEQNDVSRANPETVSSMTTRLAEWRNSCEKSAAGYDYQRASDKRQLDDAARAK